LAVGGAFGEEWSFALFEAILKVVERLYEFGDAGSFDEELIVGDSDAGALDGGGEREEDGAGAVEAGSKGFAEVAGEALAGALEAGVGGRQEAPAVGEVDFAGLRSGLG
jgi:hypothetical protein